MTFADFLNFISQDIRHFSGFMFVLLVTYTFLYKLIKTLCYRLMSAITIWRNGYPPEHTDIEGNTWDNDLRTDDFQ